jgi:hypothetical protein
MCGTRQAWARLTTITKADLRLANVPNRNVVIRGEAN